MVGSAPVLQVKEQMVESAHLCCEGLIPIHVSITAAIVGRRHLICVVPHVNERVYETDLCVAKDVGVHRVTVRKQPHVPKDGDACRTVAPCVR